MKTSNNVSNDRPNANLDSKQWDEAIKDAEGEIRVLAKQRVRLQQAVRIFKANKRDGVKWPGGGIIGHNG